MYIMLRNFKLHVIFLWVEWNSEFNNVNYMQVLKKGCSNIIWGICESGNKTTPQTMKEQ